MLPECKILRLKKMNRPREIGLLRYKNIRCVLETPQVILGIFWLGIVNAANIKIEIEEPAFLNNICKSHLLTTHPNGVMTNPLRCQQTRNKQTAIQTSEWVDTSIWGND